MPQVANHIQQKRIERKVKNLAPKWAYGVTTVPSRLNTTLPRTLASLEKAGFDTPRLFIDGATERDAVQYERFGLELTTRFPAVRTYGNWVLSMWETYLRNPTSQYYVIFQDDFVTYKNLREFLERQQYPERGYWNLYSFNTNEPLLKQSERGWIKAGTVQDKSQWQSGRGAVALVFNREAITTVLSASNMVLKPLDPHDGWRKVDGAVVTAMNINGWTEYIHNPSLVQHTGYPSTTSGMRHAQARTFLGEDFDALDLLK